MKENRPESQNETSLKLDAIFPRRSVSSNHTWLNKFEVQSPIIFAFFTDYWKVNRETLKKGKRKTDFVARNKIPPF